MPESNITPQDYEQATGAKPFTQGDYTQFSEDLKNDPFGLWWRTFVEGKGAAGQNVQGLMRPDAPAKLGAATLAGDIRNAPAMNALYQQGFGAANRANPYNTQIADQSRAAQLALINQMRGQMNGPSLAGLQGQRAMAQSGQQALGAAAMGAPGRAAMMQAGQVGGGMAGDIGQARLAEVMRAQAGMGGASGNLRGADIRSADAQAQAGLAQLRQDEALRQFYGRQGAALEDARNQALANRRITEQQLKTKRQKEEMGIADQQMGLIANIFGMGSMFGGGGK